ncbi:hypothetical protein ALC60_01661, partial [Trachymyrmex zeteki]
ITTTKSLEFCINYLPLFIDFDLKFHHIATSWCSYKTCSNLLIILIQGTNISRIFIVIYYLFNCKISEHFHLRLSVQKYYIIIHMNNMYMQQLMIC